MLNISFESKLPQTEKSIFSKPKTVEETYTYTGEEYKLKRINKGMKLYFNSFEDACIMVDENNQVIFEIEACSQMDTPILYDEIR